MIELFLLGVALSSQPTTDLVAAAAASSRPPECMAAGRAGRSRGASIWRAAQVPNLARYCRQMGRAQARIESDAAGAQAAAQAADELIAGRAAPKVVLARVALQKGQVADALALFDAALKLDPRSVEQPLAMHDLARARQRSGQLSEALDTYRVLVPRASLLPDRMRRARVLLEAAHVAMAVAASDVEGRSRHLEEALAFLREAARDPHQPLRLDVALSLVLALDRAGRQTQADATLAEQDGVAGWAQRPQADYLVSADEMLLLRGLALEASQAALAQQYYQEYLASPSGQGPFADAVKRRLARAVTRPAARGGRPGR